mmetsp:Transcript_35069/g.82587  ORF Transcript_35069/g.82587 Transcript_35069/m.82587 type:complete len:313 (-) Transcript_35069:419-1357(-)
MEPELNDVNQFENDESPVLDFGRHKGRTYLDVALNEPAYCSWAKQIQEPGEKMASFVEWLAEHNTLGEEERVENDDEGKVEEEEEVKEEEDEEEEEVLDFGPHRGRTYTDVAINEPGWCRAVRDMHQKEAMVQKFADWLETFEQSSEAAPDSGETEVEAENYEYWAEQEKTNEEEEEAEDSYARNEQIEIEELEGIAHAEPGAFTHDENGWESSEGDEETVNCLWQDSDDSCGAFLERACEEEIDVVHEEEHFQTFIEEEAVDGKRGREDLEYSEPMMEEGGLKRARMCGDEVMFALAQDVDRLTPPDLKLE